MSLRSLDYSRTSLFEIIVCKFCRRSFLELIEHGITPQPASRQHRWVKLIDLVGMLAEPVMGLLDCTQSTFDKLTLGDPTHSIEHL